MSRRPPTMNDVARLAGTSSATVSNVIHEHQHVRPETRARVLAAIETLGYHVNIAARSLAQRESKSIGIVLGNLENPWYATLAAQMEQTARALGYSVIIVSTGRESLRGPDSDVETSRIRDLVEHRVAAIVFVAFSGSPDLLRNVPVEIPAVFVTNQGSGGPSVTVDDRRGATLAVEHLLALGHRRIGYVSTNSNTDPVTDDDRHVGWMQALSSAGAFGDSEPFVVRLDGAMREHDAARDAIDALLTRGDRPTAIFASSDYTALEILDRADALGVRVPEDLSLIGFDDITIAGLTRISLTTVAQPTEQLVEHGVRTAIELAGGNGEDVRVRTLLEPRLVVRATTGPPPG